MEEGGNQGVAFVTLYARIVFELARNPRISQESLSRQLEVTIRTVQRHMLELERTGFIFVQRDRKPFTYEVAWNRSLPHFDGLTVAIFQSDAFGHDCATG